MDKTFKAIHEAWLSPNPNRLEVYDHNTIWINVPNGDMGLNEDFQEFGLSEIMDSLNGEDGLWKVVVEIHYTYSRDYWGEWDLDVGIVKVLSKSKCKSFSELIKTWCDLNNKKRFTYNKEYYIM